MFLPLFLQHSFWLDKFNFDAFFSLWLYNTTFQPSLEFCPVVIVQQRTSVGTESLLCVHPAINEGSGPALTGLSDSQFMKELL